MLAAISPAADDFEETLSTLRYAHSAKQIVNQPQARRRTPSTPPRATRGGRASVRKHLRANRTTAPR